MLPLADEAFSTDRISQRNAGVNLDININLYVDLGIDIDIDVDRVWICVFPR